MRLLDTRFKYTPSTRTNIANTWRRFGFHPTTQAERNARIRRLETQNASDAQPYVTELKQSERKAIPPALHLAVKG